MKEKIDFQGTGRDYFSASQLKALYKSPGNYQAYLDKVWETTKSLEFGTLVHMAILEPDKFKETYIKMPSDKGILKKIFDALDKANEGKAVKKEIKAPRRTKMYTDWKNSYIEKAEAKGQKIMTDLDVAILEKIITKAYLTGVMDTFFSGGEAEKTIKVNVDNYDKNFDALAIIDYSKPDMNVDLKTTSSDLSSFKWDAKKYGYDVQAALTSSMENKPFIFIVVQTVEPYDIAVFNTSQQFLEYGAEKINQALGNWNSWTEFQGNDYLQEFTL